MEVFEALRQRLAGASLEHNPEGAAAASVAAALHFSHGVAEAGPSPRLFVHVRWCTSTVLVHTRRFLLTRHTGSGPAHTHTHSPYSPPWPDTA